MPPPGAAWLRPRLRPACGVIAALALLTAPAGAQTTTATSSTTSTTAAPAVTAPPFDLGAIHADQLEVIRLQYAPQIDPAQTALNDAQSALSVAETELNQDQQTATNEATTATLDQLALRRDLTAKQQADAAYAQARATLAHDRGSLVSMAVQLYVGDPTAGPVSNVQQLEQQGIAQQLARAAIGQIAATVHADNRAVAATGRTATQAGNSVERDANALADAQANAQRAAAAIGPDTNRVSASTQQVGAATAALTKASAALNRALSAFGSAAPDGSISILGPAALDADQLTAWFNSSGFVDLTNTPIDQLAKWYISEGAREGVRGDVAFAQSIVETGGFASPDAITLNNFAGIGHCDSCAAGAPFPSAQLGIRGQMQLLRTYATPGLTAATLADPPATAEVRPESDFRRGCCPSWQQLTGTWATSPIYGPTILNVYQRILAYTVNVAGGAGTVVPLSGPAPGT